MTLLEQVMEEIKAQVKMGDEQLAQVSGAIKTMIDSGAFAAHSAEPSESAGSGQGDGEDNHKGLDAETIKATVLAVLEEAGLTSGDPTGRPPYAFKGVDSEGSDEENDVEGNPFKAIAVAQLGDIDRATKAIANDLYGPDYAMKRYEQRQAYGQYLRSGERGLSMQQVKALKTLILTPTQIKAMARATSSVRELKTDLSNIVGQLGAYMVPEDYRMEMIERLPGVTVVRPRADVMRTTSDVMSRIKVTGGGDRHPTGMRVTWVGDVPDDGDADTNPTFGVEKTPIHIAKATVSVPMALLEDSGVPLADKVTGWASEEFGLDEDEQFLVGNGIAKPEGILPGGSNTHSLTEVVTGAASTIDEADFIYTARRSLARQYRQSAAWIMNETTAGLIDKLKDGNGRYLWENSLQAGEPDRLAGYPVLTDEAMPDVAANAYPIIFGSLRGYQIADRIGLSVRRDDLTQAEQDIVKFLFRRRLGGQVAREWAFVVVKVAAS